MITLQERVHGIQLPSNWRLNKLHNVLRVRKGTKNAGLQEDNLLSLSYGRIIRKNIESSEGLLPESFETYQVVDPGNIVMRLTDLQNDKRSLRQGLVAERGIITSAYDALEVGKDNDPRFWAYTLLALDMAKYYYSLGGGVRQSVKFSDFPNEWLGAPDALTQKAIADFLDRETTRIDQLTEKKKKQVSLFETRFASQLHANITGVPTDGQQVKDSGVEWFGSIPQHWIMKPLRHVVLFQRGHDLPADQRVAGNVPLVSSGGITSEHNVASARGPGIVTGRYGTIGAFYFVDKDYWPLNTALYSKRIYEEPRFVWYLLQDLAHVFILNSSKSAVPGIDRNDLHSEKVPVPPREEQRAIARLLDIKNEERTRIIGKIDQSIRQLSELRASLITAAVTGRIDVVTWDKRGETGRHLDRIGEAST